MLDRQLIARKLLTAFPVGQPAAVAKLLTEHVDDGSGRCRHCSRGAQAGRYRHPCAIRLAAAEARRRLATDAAHATDEPDTGAADRVEARRSDPATAGVDPRPPGGGGPVIASRAPVAPRRPAPCSNQP